MCSHVFGAVGGKRDEIIGFTVYFTPQHHSVLRLLRLFYELILHTVKNIIQDSAFAVLQSSDSRTPPVKIPPPPHHKLLLKFGINYVIQWNPGSGTLLDLGSLDMI